MEIVAEYLNGVKVIRLDVYTDERGYFAEICSESGLEALGIQFHAVQDNEAYSLKRGTLRGLHFQREPYAQAKLIRCCSGSFYNLAADIRRGSPTFGQAVCTKLEKGDGLLIYVPRGFAHGTAVIEDDTTYTYKVDRPYAPKPECHGGLSCFYDQKQLDWEKLLPETELILSEKDKNGAARTLAELDAGFVYRGGSE